VKALTLTQPWASLVALGAKRIETRSWWTRYRGPLAIHAAKGFPNGAGARSICMKQPFRHTLLEAGYHLGEMHTLPLGVVVATCRLADCIRLGNSDRQFNAILDHYGAHHEDDFGDYTPGRYAWILADVCRLPEPIPARGFQGLWEWDAPAGTVAAGVPE
jgi:hypothetical protein